MMRCRPGTVAHTAFATVPDQRCTASLSLALHRIRDTSPAHPSPWQMSRSQRRNWLWRRMDGPAGQCRRVKPAGDTHGPPAPPSSGLLVLMGVVGPGEHVGTARLGRPEFPRPPSLDRMRTVAPVAGIDLALAQILDLAAQLLGMQERPRIARQVDRHAHHL